MANQQTPGLAAVTSLSGNIQVIGEDGRITQPELHGLVQLDAHTVRSEADANLVLSLSNGIGLGISGSTSLKVKNYTQAPFSKRQEGLQFEPSVSKLRLQLEEGLIAIAFEHLSPLSSAEVSLPAGNLKLHSGKILLATHIDGTSTICVVSGTATLNYTKSGEREFLSAGQAALIKDADTELTNLSTIAPEWLTLTDAADYSRQRVLFRGEDSEKEPAVIWVTPVDQLEKQSDRPYSFEL